MNTETRWDLTVRRNDDVWERPLRIIGPNLTGIDMRAQFRLAGDTPGAPLADLALITNGNAEGVRLASATQQDDGTWTNDVRIRLNKSTRQALPYAGEVGDAATLEWGFLIGGVTRIEGKVFIPAQVYGSDAAPLNRPPSYGTRTTAGPAFNPGATLTISQNGGATLAIDGADLLAPYARAAQDALDRINDFTQGPTGPAGPTFLTLAAFKAAPTSNEKQALKAPGIPDGDFYWRTGDFTGQADDISVIKADSTPLSDGAWKRQEAEGIAAAGAPSAPPLTGRTMQRYIDDDLPPAWFGIVGDGSANDDAGVGYAMEFATELAQAPDSGVGGGYDPALLTQAAVAKPLSFRGKVMRVTQPRTLPQRKVDRTNSRQVISEAVFQIDGNFTLFTTDVSDPLYPSAEFVMFRNVLFRNADPANTASCFDPRFLRMWFDHCEWWQQRCLDSDRYAQEWLFNACVVRLTPSDQDWFRSVGSYAVRSHHGKYQYNKGGVFNLVDLTGNTGCTASAFMGDTVESNGGHFLRAGHILNLNIGGGFYSEKNELALFNFLCAPSGSNRGIVLSFESDPTEANRANPDFADVIWGRGGGTSIGSVGTGNLHDNRQCGVNELRIIDDVLYDPINNKKTLIEIEIQTGLLPDPLEGYGTKITARLALVLPSNAVETQTVCLPPPIKGMEHVVINGLGGATTTFTLRPSWSADGAKFRGGTANVGVVIPPAATRRYVCLETGTWDLGS